MVHGDPTISEITLSIWHTLQRRQCWLGLWKINMKTHTEDKWAPESWLCTIRPQTTNTFLKRSIRFQGRGCREKWVEQEATQKVALTLTSCVINLAFSSSSHNRESLKDFIRRTNMTWLMCGKVKGDI